MSGRQRGYAVFAVNPHADQVEGDTCYHDLGRQTK
jgi:predicted CoA-binding protein